MLSLPLPQPCPDSAIRNYRDHAAGYDRSAERTMPLRRRTIAHLALRPGDTVLDVGCGTGLSVPLLVEAVGPAGHVVGVEQSPEMMALARIRVAAGGWRNVTLLEVPVEAAEIPAELDAVLFNYVPDVLRSETALGNVSTRAKARARVAAAGVRYPLREFLPARRYTILTAGPCLTTYDGLTRPWDRLQRFAPNVVVESAVLGTGFIAHGHASG